METRHGMLSSIKTNMETSLLCSIITFTIDRYTLIFFPMIWYKCSASEYITTYENNYRGQTLYTIRSH